MEPLLQQLSGAEAAASEAIHGLGLDRAPEAKQAGGEEDEALQTLGRDLDPQQRATLYTMLAYGISTTALGTCPRKPLY